MANHKKRPGYHGCHLCKPHKDMGNSREATKPKYRLDKLSTSAYNVT